MPLKLVPPRKGKSPNWTIRGTYMRVAVNRSSGTHRKAAASRLKRDIEGQIERGEYGKPVPQAGAGPTFLSAAVAYMKSGGERAVMGRLIEHFGETPLSDFNQAMIDEAALAILPNVLPVTRNRKVYSPVSAVLHSAGIDINLRRPPGSKSREKTDYMTPPDAAAIIAAADKLDAEFGLLLRFLLYTGVRIGEALALRWEDTEIERSFARVRMSKNGDPRPLRLRPDLCAMLLTHRGIQAHGKVFRFRWGGGFKDLLLKVKLTACGVAIPKRRKNQPKEERRTPPHRLRWVTFHTFRHTWATWFRQYAGGDVQGLVATGNWRDARSAARYAHVQPRDEWNRVDSLPSIDGGLDVETQKTGT